MYWPRPTGFCLSYMLWYISEIKKKKRMTHANLDARAGRTSSFTIRGTEPCNLLVLVLVSPHVIRFDIWSYIWLLARCQFPFEYPLGIRALRS